MAKAANEIRNIKPQKAIEILKNNHVKISEEEAEIILEFMYFIGKLAVNQYFKDFNFDDAS